MVSQTSPIPDQYMTTMKYCQDMLLTTAANVSVCMFRTNGIQDPDVAPHIAGDGQHQSFGFDQLGGLYKKHRCYGMKYKITFVNTSLAYDIDLGVVGVISAVLAHC